MEDNKDMLTDSTTGFNPILSVIVPVYNAEKYLDNCINSILNQTFTNFELILVDDGSKDRSAEICDKYADIDGRVKVIHKTNGGVRSARNEGLKESKGIYVSYADADDWLDLDAYESMMRLVVQEDADILACGYIEENPDGTILRSNEVKTGVYRGRIIEDKVLTKVLYTGDFYSAGLIPALWNKIFRKDILTKNQFNVSDAIVLGEDSVVTYPALLEADCIVVDNSICSYHYRIIQTSMAHSFNQRIFQDAFLLYQNLSEVFKAKNNENMLVQLNYYICYILLLGVSRVLSRGCQENLIRRYRILKNVAEMTFVSEVISKIEFEKVDKRTKKQLELLYKHRIVQYIFEEILFKVMRYLNLDKEG